MKENHIDVVLERAKIIGNLYLEKFAHLDNGYNLSKNKELPEGHYCVFYRACVCVENSGYFYLPDWSSSISKDLPGLIFFLNKE